METRTCKNCGRELPLELFERYATGTHRWVCRQCHYQLHVVRAKRKWRMRQLARLLVKK